MLTIPTATFGESLRDLASRPAVPLLLFGAAFATYALRSETLSSGDAMLHVRIARDAWARPELFFDVWGRPVFTALYAVPALLGLPAVRLFSAAISLLTCFATYRLAAGYGMRRAALVIPLVALQPYFFQSSFDGLTELPFACLVVCALWAYQRERWLTCALLASLLSMARWEGVLLMGLWSPFLARRRWWLPLVVFTPHLVWNGFNALTFSDPLAWLFPFDSLWRDPNFTPKSHEMRRLLFYAGGATTILGPALFFLSQLGLFARTWRRTILAASLLSVALFYILAAWRMPGVRGAAVPMYRYFAGLAPLLAICCLDGLDVLLDSAVLLRHRRAIASFAIFESLACAFLFFDQPWPAAIHFYVVAALLILSVARPPSRPAWRAALVAFVLASSVFHVSRLVRPFSGQGALAFLASRVAAYLHQEAPQGGPILFSEPFLGAAVADAAPPGARFDLSWMNVPRVLALPVGGWVAWDSVNSPLYFFHVPRSLLDEHPGFAPAVRFARDGVEIRLYRRVRGDTDDSSDFRKFTKPYWPDKKGSGMTDAYLPSAH